MLRARPHQALNQQDSDVRAQRPRRGADARTFHCAESKTEQQSLAALRRLAALRPEVRRRSGSILADGPDLAPEAAGSRRRGLAGRAGRSAGRVLQRRPPPSGRPSDVPRGAGSARRRPRARARPPPVRTISALQETSILPMTSLEGCQPEDDERREVRQGVELVRPLDPSGDASYLAAARLHEDLTVPRPREGPRLSAGAGSGVARGGPRLWLPVHPAPQSSQRHFFSETRLAWPAVRARIVAGLPVPAPPGTRSPAAAGSWCWLACAATLGALVAADRDPARPCNSPAGCPQQAR